MFWKGLGRHFCDRSAVRTQCHIWVDAVEKGKNELIESFAFAPVETGFS
jgi:hypothetical protein